MEHSRWYARRSELSSNRMDRHAVFHRVVEPHTVIRALLLGLLASLLLLADGYVLILASRLIPVYLLLAVAASTGVGAIVLIMGSYRALLRSMRYTVASGRYPQRQFRRMIPLLAAAGLLIAPGFATDVLGLLLLARPVGWILGAFFERSRRPGFLELYEYLRLRD
jgi:UPF0716 protein FxsA